MTSAINGLGDYYQTYQTTDATTQKLQQSLQATDKTSSEDELLDACKEFETYFVEQVMKSMEAFTKVPGAEDEETSSKSSSYYETFKSTLTEEMAGTLTDNADFGIANVLYEQMKRNYGISE